MIEVRSYDTLSDLQASDRRRGGSIPPDGSWEASVRTAGLALLVLLAVAPALACRSEIPATNSPREAGVQPTAAPSEPPTEMAPPPSPAIEPSPNATATRPILTAEPGLAGPRGSTIASAPIAGRFGHAAAWTDQEVVIVGGQRDYESVPFDDGAAYDPKTGDWRTIPRFPLGPRSGATALWTGSEVIVWGGSAGDDGPMFLGDGAAYDPAADAWRLIALPRGELTTNIWYGAIWTGAELMIWGGRRGSDPVSMGAAYDPRTDHWHEIPAGPLVPRFAHSMVWTGEEVVIWGGRAADESERVLGDGAAFDPARNSWRVVAPAPLEPRSGHIAVLTDGRYARAEMLVWSGRGESGEFLPNAAMYDPKRDGWRLIDIPEIAPRVDATAVWTGREAIVWGGVDRPPPGCHEGARDNNPYAACDGITFTPAAANRRGQWYQIPPGPLSVRAGHSAVWAGDVMVIWGGIDRNEQALADGAVYDPQIHWLNRPLAPTELAESDRFWEWLIPMHCPGPRWNWNSLRGMAADAQVIVRGQAITVEGRFDRKYNQHVAVITFEIVELLKGQPMSRVEKTVDLLSYDGDGNSWRLRSNLPDGEHLLFLMNVGDVEGADATEDERYSYFLPSYQTVLREIDGRVVLFDAQTATEFLERLDGRPFEEVVGDVRGLVSLKAPLARATGIGSAGLARPMEDRVPRILYAC